MGPVRAITNTLFLAFFIFLVVQSARQSGNPFATTIILVMAGVPIVIGFFAPLMMLNPLVRNAHRTSHLIRLLQFAVIAMVLAALVFQPPVPWWGWLAMLGVVSFLHGLVFWFMSDSRVLTERGAQSTIYAPASRFDEADRSRPA